MRNEGLPEVFFFELTDLYDKKNLPKVIYCIHALSHLLAKKGKAPNIKNLVGHLEFSDDLLNSTAQNLEDAAVNMPSFGNIQNELAKEMNTETEEQRLAREEEEARLKRAQYLEEHISDIVKAQSVVRMYLAKKVAERERAAQTIQRVWKGYKQRRNYQNRLMLFKSNEKLFEKIQARFKGKRAREDYLKKHGFYHAHVKEIVKIQAWWRGVNARKQYHALRLNRGGANLKVVRQYLHLLEHSDFDFDDEKALDELKRQVVQKIRENLAAEKDLNDLDSKVALLVKNRITIEEVAHFKSKDMRAALAKTAQSLANEAGIISFRGNDKDTKERKKKYEELFYLLQTEPVYLAGLMFTLNKKSGGSATKFLEQVVLTLYGYAQNAREEYLFIKLIEACIKIELDEVSKVDELVRENPLFIKLVLQYTRGAKEREYLRGLLRPLLEFVLENNDLDLESDPIAIYKATIREEEIRTGEKSAKPYDVTAEVAAADPDVKNIQMSNFEKLKKITDMFLLSIVKSINKMPYGIRYVAMKLKEAMKLKFPNADQEKDINLMIGNLLYYRYINPVIVAPEAFDVIESAISPIQRKNLAEVAKTLHQISVNKSYGATESDSYLQAYSNYIKTASVKFAVFLREASSVVSAEEFFDINEYLDTGRKESNSVYITPDEIILVHHSLVENLEQLPNLKNDSLRVILSELGPPPALGTAAKGPGSEVVLRLSNRFAKIIETDPVKDLVQTAKRMVTVIIKFSTGRTLLDILEDNATPEEEAAFAQFLLDEEQKHNNVSVHNSIENLHGQSTAPEPHSHSAFQTLYKENGKFKTLQQFKIKALELMSQLEQHGTVSKKDHYQSMLDSIVEDMLTKQRRRDFRKKEFASLRKTLNSLQEKSKFLDDSLKSYHDYIDSCMAQLTNKKGKNKKAPMIFSKQYYHIQGLKKAGKVPQFGSFKYNGAELHKKGVLISIDDHTPKQYGLLTLTISSDEAGIFTLDVTLLGKSLGTETLKLEDLLQHQYNKVDIITILDCAKVNVNLLVFLINKKFYV
ncbi:hypothetical protein HK103_007118 [Boothiomyces macroporosus]|uniref:Ras-GAP domain-containing protein n=1 Tax=Boothiomyces macroporosus TaxID=261099 RepID=A0AAD5UDB1_9FUNG|nr:hypothetical protein HK103_007118 [Boothiomyces macroporosus]